MKRFYALFKYVVSYLLAAVFPLLIVMTVSYNFFIDAYQAEVMENRLSSLLIVRNSFELMLNQMENIVKQIQMEDDLDYNMDDKFDTAIKLRNRLNKYLNSTTYLKDIQHYIHGSDTICAASSTYSLESYAQTVNVISGLDAEEYYQYLNEVETRLVLPSRKERMMGLAETESLTFLYPLPYLETSPYATVVFKIDTNTLRKTFHIDADHNYSIIIESPGEDVIIAADQRMQELVRALLDAAPLEEASGTFLHSLDGEDYMIAYQKSVTGGATYLYMTPTRIALRQVYRIKESFILVMLGLFAIELVFLFLIAYRNYQPIRSLGKLISNQFSADSHSRAGSEIQTAERLLSDMAVTHRQLNEQLVLYQDSMREVVLYKMINGGFATLQELQDTQHSSGIMLTKPCLRVAILQLFPESGAEEPGEDAVQQLFRQHIPGAQIYCCRLMGRYVFIIADDEAEDGEYRRCFEEICGALRTLSCPAGYCVGVSDQCSDISTLHLSYIQANTALDYRYVGGNNHAIFYADIISDNDIYRIYPYREIEEIHNAVLGENRERFEGMVDQVAGLLRHHNNNLILAKLVSYDVVNVILKAALESGRGFTPISSKAPNIVYLSATHSIEDLLETIMSVKEETLKYLGGKEKASNALMEQVIQVINDNVFDYSFSVKRLADQFGLSQNNLSQQFKRYTSQSPSDYINYLKIEKAKYYLANFPMPIRVIVEKLGYSNESSFIRKFKESTGVTPGEYRKRAGPGNGR